MGCGTGGGWHKFNVAVGPWQRGREDIGSSAEMVKVPFYSNRDYDRIILGQLPPSSRRVVASLDKALYNDYLCLVASNKSKLRRAATPKRVRIHSKDSIAQPSLLVTGG